MGYDEKLAERARRVLAERGADAAERRMFGGICFMVDGSMCCGVLGADLCVRVGPEQAEEALAERHVRPFDFTGRPAKGMVYVAPAGTRTAAQLRKWIGRGLAFIERQPPKR